MTPVSRDMRAGEVLCWIAFGTADANAWRGAVLNPADPQHQYHLRASEFRVRRMEAAVQSLLSELRSGRVTAEGLRDGTEQSSAGEKLPIARNVFLTPSITITTLGRVQQKTGFPISGINGGPGYGEVCFKTEEILAIWPTVTDVESLAVVTDQQAEGEQPVSSSVRKQATGKRSPGAPQRYDWGRTKQQALAWLEDEGEPFPGEQVKLENYVASLFSDGGPAESTIRLHVVQWIEEFRTRK